MASPAGFEPAALRLGGECSILLSYGDMAERVGFEPTVGCPTLVFKTSAFDHSATSP